VANNNIEKGNNNNNNSGNRNEAEILIDVASSMVVSSPGESLKLSQKALNIARASKNKDNEIRALITIGVAYAIQNKHSIAIETFNTAMKISKEEKMLELQTSCLIDLGRIYNLTGNYQQALYLLLQAFDISNKIHNSKLIADVSINL
jgi:tetratricopeptide (TPR) repeat protein